MSQNMTRLGGGQEGFRRGSIEWERESRARAHNQETAAVWHRRKRVHGLQREHQRRPVGSHSGARVDAKLVRGVLPDHGWGLRQAGHLSQQTDGGMNSLPARQLAQPFSLGARARVRATRRWPICWVENKCAYYTTHYTMLRANNTPTALLWGVNDPWITEKKAKQLLGLNPDADYIPLVAGHCPHDEKPADFNAGLNEWLAAKGL
eukprot:6122512-Pyramimonas_sp.AAC.4